MGRPYFSFSGQQLADLFQSSRSDTKVLSDIHAELTHRNAKRMIALRKEVGDVLDSLLKQKKSFAQPAADIRPNEQINLGLESDDANPSSYEKAVEKSEYDEELEPEQGYVERLGGLGAIRGCGKLTDVPSRWHAPEKDDLKLDLPDDAPYLLRYSLLLRALIKEMKRKGIGMRTVAIRDGESIVLDGRERGYVFAYDGDKDLFEGAKVLIALGNRSIDGRLVSVSNRSITLSVSEDLGPRIDDCTLKIDNSAMLEALADRLDSLNKGEFRFNHAIADDVISNQGDESPASEISIPLGLNEMQERAVAKILGNVVTYLWGPPGTGKTKTLSTANQVMFEQGKRILVCSNTNQAVDQVLLKLCETLGKSHPAMDEGKIIRLGQIQHVELKSEWSEWITLDGIVGRRSLDLRRRKETLEAEILMLQQSIETAQKKIDSFKLLDAVNKKIEENLAQQVEVEQSMMNTKKAIERAQSQLTELQEELRHLKVAGFMRRLVLRSEEDINKDIKKAHSLIDKESRKATEQDSTSILNGLAKKNSELKLTRDTFNQNLIGLNRLEAQKEIDVAEEKMQPFNQEISEINRKLEEIENTIVNEAKIIGATVTKTYLSPQLFNDFDVVIIDEASMVMLPIVYYVSGLAREKVVISGDFRQLSPIVTSEQSVIMELLGEDVFASAGIEKAFNNKESLKRVVMLEYQYRMQSRICDLISPRMYDGRLKTADAIQQEVIDLPSPFNADLIIVDTSPIQPFVNKHGTSRYNLMNALVIRNICRYLRESGFVDGRKRLGVCTPYAAQKELIGRVLDSWNLSDLVDTGTVHRYQGDEKTAMIIDISDSIGERYVGMFSQAEHPQDNGAKLFNVAVSRAKQSVIFVANLSYLDQKLPAQAFLREILHSVSAKGRVVDVRDVLAMWPIQDELKRLGNPFILDPETLKSGLFRQTDFDAVCGEDISGAKSSVAIFSGFITPQRVASYESTFRRKRDEGVSIRCVTRPPQRNGSIPEDMGRDALNGLEAMGCIVDTRWDIHQKVVIIDDEIVWFGSLNPLSHTNKTDEMMARIASASAARAVSAFMSLGSHGDPDKAAGLSVVKENPTCSDCGSRTIYRTGSYGPFWQCEVGCGWRESYDRPKSKNSPDPGLKKEGPRCPICSSGTVLRRGSYGNFYGCTKYPNCNGTIQLKPIKSNNKSAKTRH